EQVAVVRRILADAPATEADLECGHRPTRVAHNCSGEHAGFLALSAARGWPFEGYRHAWHPCQEAVLDVIEEAVETSPLATAVGACGVPTSAARPDRGAPASARIGSLEGGPRVAGAMCAHPDLLRGPVA